MVISNNIHTFNWYLIFDLLKNVPLTYHELKAPSDINKNEDLTSNNHGNSGSSKLTDLDMNTSDTLERFEENEDVSFKQIKCLFS